MRAPTKRILTAYICTRCDVEGRDAEADPSCWSCQLPDRIKVTARPTDGSLPSDYGG